MCRCSDRGRIHLCGEQESGTVWTELNPETGEEVDELERMATSSLLVQRREDGSCNNEKEERHDEADCLHPLSAVEFVVHKQGCHVISNKLTPNVDQVIQPKSYHLVFVTCDQAQKDIAKDLIAIERKIVAKPADGRSKKAMPIVIHDNLEGLNVVSSDVAALSGGFEILIDILHLKDTKIEKVQNGECGNTERDPEGVLGCRLRIRRVGSGMKDEQKEDENELVRQLTPSLHQESESHASTSVQLVVSGVVDAMHTFHGRDTGHGVLSSNTNGEDQKRDSVHNGPTRKSRSPHGGQEQSADEHDQCVLDESPAASNPVADNTDDTLTADDAQNLHVADACQSCLKANAGFASPDSLHHGLVAYFVMLEALRPN